MTATFYVGDAVTVMNTLPEKSVDLILTSPPFLALRSYLPQDHPDKALEGGSQATPGAYIDWLLDVVEACARVLAPHGSLCFELGDTYAGSGGAGGDYQIGGLREGEPSFDGSGKFERHEGRNEWEAAHPISVNRQNSVPTKGTAWPLAKSLSLIPETFRFAMVYGINPHTGRKTEPWRLRNVIRWVRPNPPVGALGDKFRPATSELMVFCKAKDRFFDLDAVREPPKRGEAGEALAPNRRTVGYRGSNAGGQEAQAIGRSQTYREGPHLYSSPAGAPPLDWWNIPPGGYPGAHYAVWPPELLVKPIKAMCPEKVCRRCGEPSRRIVESERHLGPRVDGADRRRLDDAVEIGTAWLKNPTDASYMTHHGTTTRTELGFTDCGHDDYRPGLVLDPFAGSGTTLSVATGHGRDAIGIDLDERNYELSLDRVGPLILQRGEVPDGAAPKS